MSKQRDLWFAFFVSLVVLVLVSVPFLLALRAAGEAYVFTGFLHNPLDGNTYLAKMYQGWQGAWHFQLPYTAEAGEGAYLFLFYLALGHLARILALPHIVVFHFARLAGAILLLWTLWRYLGALFSAPRPRKFAFALTAIGSGMGWLMVFLGALTSDFWVAEAYPFLSFYANPHFPLSLALMLWLIMPPIDEKLSSQRLLRLLFASFVLSVINPFGVVVVLMVLGGCFLWMLLCKNWSWNLFWRIFGVVLSGLPIMVYDLWAVSVDPVLAGWDAQNLTPSPPLWDLLISLSPAFLLAAVGTWGIFQNRKRDELTVFGSSSAWIQLVVWAFLGLVLMYFPWDLQRRFIIGFYIPVVGLAAIGLEMLATGEPRRYRVLAAGIFLLVIPTNLIVLLAGVQAAGTNDPKIYLTQAEGQALSWIEEHTEPSDLILSGPEMGLFIPAHTGRQVIYGHPFETVDAENEKLAVVGFFSGENSDDQLQRFIVDRGVDYIYYGPRERNLGSAQIPDTWEALFQADDVVIYQPILP